MWNELENKAADIYVEIRREEYVHKSTSDCRVPWLIKPLFGSDMSRPSFAALFNAALSRAPETLSNTDLEQTEDSDEWMNVDAKDFDEMLERTMRVGDSTVETHAMDMDGGGGEEDRVAKEQTDKLRDLAAKVEQFVEGKGDVEGARFEECAFPCFYIVIFLISILVSVVKHSPTKMAQRVMTTKTYSATRIFLTRMTKGLTRKSGKQQSRLASKRWITSFPLSQLPSMVKCPLLSIRSVWPRPLS